MTQVQQAKCKTTENRFEYVGQTRKVYGIWVSNLILGIITLGIYSFWGKAKMRKYVANNFSLLKDRFEYRGTGGELFRGFCKAIPVIILISLFYICELDETPWVIPMYAFFLYFTFVATYQAQKYKLSRTTWRGIRGKLTGSAFKYAQEKMIRMFLNIITLGLLIPSSDIKINKFITENTHFGNVRFSFDAKAESLFNINVITLLLAIPTLGLSRFWYHAELKRHLYTNSTINNLRIKATHTGGSLLSLFLVNILINIFTLGLGSPIVMERNLKYFSEHVFIMGDINTSGILQSCEKLSSSGEGLEEIFGMDLGFM